MNKRRRHIAKRRRLVAKLRVKYGARWANYFKHIKPLAEKYRALALAKGIEDTSNMSYDELVAKLRASSSL
jgi:hypothetical protein